MAFAKCCKNPFLDMGSGTHPVPLALFAENRSRLCTELKKIDTLPANSFVFLQGGDNISFYDTDVDYLFRQESYFMWTFGVLEPGCYGLVEVATGKATLFVPHLPGEYAVWMGPLLTLKDYKKKYCVDDVVYTKELQEYLGNKDEPVLLTLKGVNSDSGLTSIEAKFDGIEEFKVNNTILFPVIAECRVYKTDKELQVLRYVISLSSAAHREVMREASPGCTEYQCESVFLNHCYKIGGARHVSYTCICGTGPNGAILHYGHAAAPNNRGIQEGDMCLFDMGANYFGYAADITCSFPVNGKFTDDQKLIYEAVLKANEAVKNEAKPGVSWVNMHRLSNKTMLQALKDGGLLKGDVNEMLEAGLAAIFQPHGLGHFMGLDVHDVGGYLDGHPKRPAEPGFSKLRTARILKPRMVLTVEPGCYFIDPLLEKAFKDPKLSQFLVREALDRFRGFGGVRIEDNIVITEDGMEDLTKVPRTVTDIERWMAGEDGYKYCEMRC